MVGVYDGVTVFTKYIIDGFLAKLVSAKDHIYTRVKQTSPEEMMVCLVAEGYRNEIEGGQEVTKNIASRFVIFIHIRVTAYIYCIVRVLFHYFFKKVPKLGNLVYKL